MNIKAIAEKVGLDWEEALEYYGGDIAMFKEKLTSFEKDSDFPCLKKAMEEKDEQAITKCAHKIKKAAEKIGLKKIAALAEELEKTRSLKETAVFLNLESEYMKAVKAFRED